MDNKTRWDNCKVYEGRASLFKKVADRILANKSVYDKIEKQTGVPWWFVGITHYRESNLNLNTQLAQGDPLHQVSRHVPAGRGPFDTFEQGAYDALVNCAPHAARNKDWSIGKALDMFEKYNGMGYAQRSLPSPYVWAGTNQYEKGKYVRDGVFDPNAVDSQLGCAGLMKYLGVGKTSVKGPLGGATVATGAVIATAATKTLPLWIPISLGFVVVCVVGYIIYKKIKERNNVTKDQVILPEHLEQDGRLGKTDLE